MNLLEHVLYINLEERPDRKEHVENEFKKLGITPERFHATRAKSGAVGCTISHIKALELAKSRDYSQVLICEDDITFLKPKTFLKNLKKFAECNDGKDFDVLLVSGNNGIPYDQLSDFHIKITNCRTTTGYIVRKHYYDILINNFRTGLQHLIRDSENKREFALDMYWNVLQKSGKWYLLIPVTVVQYPSYSDVENRDVDYTSLIQDYKKEWMVRNQIIHSIMNQQPQPNNTPTNPPVNFRNMTFVSRPTYNP
jgi:GR25 family glycosyltransferase involved in LPS biosynthesis